MKADSGVSVCLDKTSGRGSGCNHRDARLMDNAETFGGSGGQSATDSGHPARKVSTGNGHLRERERYRLMR